MHLLYKSSTEDFSCEASLTMNAEIGSTSKSDHVHLFHVSSVCLITFQNARLHWVHREILGLLVAQFVIVPVHFLQNLLHVLSNPQHCWSKRGHAFAGRNVDMCIRKARRPGDFVSLPVFPVMDPSFNKLQQQSCPGRWWRCPPFSQALAATWAES